MENSKNVKLGKFQKFSIQKILKVINLGNSENLQFGKFQKFSIWKFQKCLYFATTSEKLKKFRENLKSVEENM